MLYKSLSNDELILKTERTVLVERETTAEVIRLFQEIQSRKLFLDYAFPSLFEMATKHFGYCAASAMRRINAMKLINDVPEAFEKIESGELSLSVVNELQTYFNEEKKADRAYSVNAKIELIESSLGKSRREVEREVANRNPERQKPETIHAISNDRVQLNISISKELLDKINELRDLKSHANPNMTIEDLLGELVEKALKEPKRRKSLPPAEVKRTRYVPVRERPMREPCCFVDQKTGRRCNSTAFLQMDHIEPYAEGGKNTRENLRWYCGAHNRQRAS